MSYYTDTIRRWATDTRRTGVIDNADGIGEVGLESAAAGRRLAVRFTLRVESERIADARYQVFGCGFSMAGPKYRAAQIATSSAAIDMASLTNPRKRPTTMEIRIATAMIMSMICISDVVSNRHAG